MNSESLSSSLSALIMDTLGDKNIEALLAAGTR
jgi:hypothetical protein